MRVVAVQRREMWNDISRRLWIRGSRRILQVSAWLMTPRVTSSLVNAYAAATLGKKIIYGYTGKTPVQWKGPHSCHLFLTWGMQGCLWVGVCYGLLSHAVILDILLAFTTDYRLSEWMIEWWYRNEIGAGAAGRMGKYSPTVSRKAGWFHTFQMFRSKNGSLPLFPGWNEIFLVRIECIVDKL